MKISKIKKKLKVLLGAAILMLGTVIPNTAFAHENNFCVDTGDFTTCFYYKDFKVCEFGICITLYTYLDEVVIRTKGIFLH